MNIILNKEAPLELVRIINQLDKDHNHGVENIIIDAFIPALASNKAIGAYESTTKTILIDLGNCLTDSHWMKYSMLYIPGVWLNAVVAVFHEFSHACQIAHEPYIAELEEDDDLIEIIEEDAMKSAMMHALEYFTNGGKTPPLQEMGWLGEQLAKTLNGIYSQTPLQVIEELDALKSGAVAEVKAAISALTHISNDDIPLLHENIDNNQAGVKMEDRYYMTMGEFIAAARN